MTHFCSGPLQCTIAVTLAENESLCSSREPRFLSAAAMTPTRELCPAIVTANVAEIAAAQPVPRRSGGTLRHSPSGGRLSHTPQRFCDALTRSQEVGRSPGTHARGALQTLDT